jgi:hypothetical protein
MIKFPLLQRAHEFELGYGLYSIYITGGFEIEKIESLDVHLIDVLSNETITLKEKSLKGGDVINGERAVLCYSFDVYNYSKYRLSIANPEIIIIKRNIDMPFTLFPRLWNFIRPNTAIPQNTIYVIIK